MGFGAILDHLEATFIHCGPFEKVEKCSIFDVILVDFGPFGAILGHFCLVFLGVSPFGPYEKPKI